MSPIVGKTTLYVISYDIEKDRIRNKISKILEGYGKRVQYSVFECRISKEQFEKLYARLADLMVEETVGNIRFYPICKNCEEKIATLGIRISEMPDPVDDFFIV